MNEKKNLILGLISTKQENKGNFKKKFKAKKQRLTIENQISSMKQQITLMQTQAQLKQKDLVLKEIQLRKQSDVKTFKQKQMGIKLNENQKMDEQNKYMIDKGKILRSMSQQNKVQKIESILAQKKAIVTDTKSFFENAVKTNADVRIRNIMQNKLQAQEIRKQEY